MDQRKKPGMNSIIKEDLEFIISARLPWGKLEGRNILITGANGFLPAYMVETILFLNDNKFRKKAKVFALVRNKKRALDRFASYGKRRDLRYVVQDICAPFKLRERFDFIIHAASQASPKYYGIDPIGTIAANTIGTANLLHAACRNNCKGFLFFSSGEVYGEIKNDNIPIREDSEGYINPMTLRSCYAEGKRAGENMCIAWNYQYKVPVKIVRPFHTYGPGMRLDDGRVYADFVSDVVSGRNIVMKSDGRATRSFCYLADAVLGFFTVLLKGKVAQAYNVGNEGAEISIKGLAHMLVNLFPEKKLKVELNKGKMQEGYIKSKVNRNAPDTGRLRNLGWRPKYSLEEGFRRTTRSFSC